jgi:hypothetical protein
MTQHNPYQPPVEELPDSLAAKLHAADWEARKRKTSAVPDVDFWIVVGIGIAIMLVANVFNRFVLVLLFAWLGAAIRVCMIYSARARAALPPINAHRLLLTSTLVCFTLQSIVLTLGFVIASHFDWQPGMWTLAVFFSSVLVYVTLFLWSIQLAKQP